MRIRKPLTEAQKLAQSQYGRRWRKKNKRLSRALCKQWYERNRDLLLGRKRKGGAVPSCDCSAPATIFKNNEWICATCDKLQAEYESARFHRETVGIPSSGLPEYRMAIAI